MHFLHLIQNASQLEFSSTLPPSTQQKTPEKPELPPSKVPMEKQQNVWLSIRNYNLASMKFI